MPHEAVSSFIDITVNPESFQSSKAWMVRSAQGDYNTMMKMLLEDPRLAKHRDFTSGFTALHWAAKHGNLDMVKMLAGTYQAHVNVKSHGGYTPLHLACQFGHQEVFDLLVKAYGGDPMIRDNHGKTPRQYMMAQEGLQGLGLAGGGNAVGLSLSSDTFRQLKDRRRSRTARHSADKTAAGGGGGGILRFGSLSVKVKKTTEAFNNYFGGSSSGERKHSWHVDSGHSSLGPPVTLGSVGRASSASSVLSSTGSDSQKMPPPKGFGPMKKRKNSSKRSSVDYGSSKANKSAPTTPTGSGSRGGGKGDKSDESDSEFGFDSQWSMPKI